VAVIEREFNLAFSPASVARALHFRQSFFRHERAHFARQSGKLVVGLGDGQAMPVGSNHGDRVRLEQEQSAIERVARFFIRDCERRLRDQRR